MKRFALETIGCRLNQYETEKIGARLNRLGFERVPFNHPADLYIINTCTVTGRADASSRNIISRASRRNSEAVVVVIGCYVDAEPDKLARLNGVDLVLGNNDKEKAVEIINRRFPELFGDGVVINGDRPLSKFHQHNRAWIKIGDGCNQQCAYCIIPLVRGRLTNRLATEVVEETNLLSANGYHEVVLTGVHIGRYKDSGANSLAELLKLILEETDISRVRLSSIEPQEITQELLDVMARNISRICRHFHIPLQSGSDRILKLMHRPYDSGRYLEIVEDIKNRVSGAVIGADIIVGFPGETERDFQDSHKVADCGFLDYLHVFSYSDRPGTEASSMTNKINPDVIKERNSVLRAVSDRRYAEALRREIGNVVGAISEYGVDNTDSKYRGITDNYLRIRFPEGAGGNREIVRLSVVGASETTLIGKLI
jgi:threonylcarbamoyladenosine tRNA methylthiotransferase MtaB